MELMVEKRETFGKAAGALRRSGLIPAELYGRGVQNLHLTVSRKEFNKVFRSAGESTMISLAVGSEKRPVFIHDLSRDPVTDEITSIDFYQVRLDEKIKVKVPLAFSDESPAVKNFGGVLVKAMQELEVEALPADMPSSFAVSLSRLTEIGQSIHVGDLEIAGSMKVSVDLKTVIATVTAKMTEEEEAKLSAAGNVAEVKVEVEEKKAERAQEKEAAGEPSAQAEKAPNPKKKE